MEFKEIRCVSAFYDDYYNDIFYCFDTVPKIGHGDWAISGGGDVAYDTRSDRVMQSGFPEELLILLQFIPDDIEVDDLPE